MLRSVFRTVLPLSNRTSIPPSLPWAVSRKNQTRTCSSISSHLQEQPDHSEAKRPADKTVGSNLSSVRHDDLHELVGLLNTRPKAPRLTFLLGGPGCGKGTLSELITSRTSLKHVSIGVLLRQIARTGTFEARAVSATISRGGVVTSEIATRLLLQHLYCNDDVSEWIVDGFPRTFANAVLVDTLGLRPKAVVAMEVPDERLLKRLQERRRRDDVDYIVRHRIEQFHTEWGSIKEFYKRRGVLVQIDADGSPEEVFKRYSTAVSTLPF